MPLIQTKVFENEFSDHERFRQMLAGACAVTLVVIMAVAIALVTTPAGNAAGRAAQVEPAQVVSEPAVARRFQFVANSNTATRVILQDFNVRIAAGCDDRGRLKVRIRLLQPGQVQSASIDAADDDETAINEITGVYKTQPRTVNLLSTRTRHQIGHTEVFTERRGAASIHWQAENPSLRWDGTGGEQRQFQCLFTGTAVG
jgi:hypothetical protein